CPAIRHHHRRHCRRRGAADLRLERDGLQQVQGVQGQGRRQLRGVQGQHAQVPELQGQRQRSADLLDLRHLRRQGLGVGLLQLQGPVEEDLPLLRRRRAEVEPQYTVHRQKRRPPPPPRSQGRAADLHSPSGNYRGTPLP